MSDIIDIECHTGTDIKNRYDLWEKRHNAYIQSAIETFDKAVDASGLVCLSKLKNSNVQGDKE